MKKFLILAVALMGLSAAVASAQMSDEAVVSYVKDATASGKSEKQIGKELLARGVTVEQMQRIKDKYESQQGGETIAADVTATSSAVVRSNARKDSDMEVANNLELVAASTSDPVEKGKAAASDLVENGKAAASRAIFGHNLFKGQRLSFEPNLNIPTPENYILGPGDEVVVDIWGQNEASFRQTISPEGRIMVSQVGPIYLSGLTIKKANDLIRKKFAQKYSSIDGDEPASEITLTLGNIRTIQVNILGEVSLPGTYRISSFSTIFHALYVSGGVTDRGTVRSIELIRNGKLHTVVDIYPFMLTGHNDCDFQLRDGDVIRVPLYGIYANITGNVKRPMYYELKEGETIKNLIDYAGGFDADAYTDEVSVVRQGELDRQVLSVSKASYASTALCIGDVVSVGSTMDRFSNKIEVRGSVFRPGIYELRSDISTVKQLINHADGLMEDAFLERARLLRQKEDFTPEVLSVNVGGIMNGLVADIPLRKNDILIIPSKHELYDLGDITIEGYVARPGTFAFAENMTIEDLILQAGGLLRGASTVRVEVARRMMDPESEMPTDKLAEVFTFPLDVNLKMDNSIKFKLEPYDIVRIRKSPGYKAQSNVTIDGEVAFPGGYTMLSNGDRISDLVQRAGGVTPHSYPRGAILMRKASTEEIEIHGATERFIRQNRTKKDTVDLSKVELRDSYTVGIELDKALANPGSDYDMVLRDGDRLFVPEYVSTVRIGGEVLFPNTVLFKPGEKISYYVKQAGGYTSKAKRSRTFVVYMNGHANTKGAGAVVEPGCEILVPAKPERKGMSTAEIMSISTSAISLATLVTNLVKLF